MQWTTTITDFLKKRTDPAAADVCRTAAPIRLTFMSATVSAAAAPLLGISQEKLAKELGVTFQQIQKYERGMNRMGSSRLWDMAQVLGVSVNFFFRRHGGRNCGAKSAQFLLPDSKPCRFEQPTAAAEDPMTRTETLELVKDYYRINNRNLAKRLKQCIHEAAKTMYNQKMTMNHGENFVFFRGQLPDICQSDRREAHNATIRATGAPAPDRCLPSGHAVHRGCGWLPEWFRPHRSARLFSNIRKKPSNLPA